MANCGIHDRMPGQPTDYVLPEEQVGFAHPPSMANAATVDRLNPLPHCRASPLFALFVVPCPTDLKDPHAERYQPFNPCLLVAIAEL
jgi:hypothetical protein